MSDKTTKQQVMDDLTKEYPLVGRRNLEVTERKPQSNGQPFPWATTDFARTIPY